MDFSFDARTEELRTSMLDFMDTHVHSAEKVFDEQLGQLEDRWAWDSVPVLQELRAEARSSWACGTSSCRARMVAG